MIIEQPPLFTRDGSGWKPVISASKSPILIKRYCPTPDAQKRFLGSQPEVDILNRHHRNTNRNHQIPYRHSDSEGEWLFYFAGEGKSDRGRKANLWDVWFLPKSQINSAA